MVFSDYTIEATRAIFEERLREASHARLVKQVRGGRVIHLIAALTTVLVVS
jgi:hypothetical protein